MKLLWAALVIGLMVTFATAQNAGEKSRPENSQPAESSANRPDPTSQSDDLPQLQADLQRLKVLLNQMRTNLAFVQTSQTPLKHQFELEADAWQLIVEQMQRRLKRMEERQERETAKPVSR
jgi:LAS superfamily LD-carboxypeptidase LdcB